MDTTRLVNLRSTKGQGPAKPRIAGTNYSQGRIEGGLNACMDIDQDLCTGDGLCEEICPDIFFAGDDGLFYVKDVGEKANPGNPRLRMAQGLARVPDNLLDAVIEAAEDCPGECIFIEE